MNSAAGQNTQSSKPVPGEFPTDTALFAQYLPSPLGLLKLIADADALRAIEFESQHTGQASGAGEANTANKVLDAARTQLEEYFAGERRTFSVPLDARGTAFQHQVWQALRQIPYGEVRSYRDIAISLGKEKAVRAVGAANGRNPLPIIVPCHRVIGSDGSLTGFAGGIEAKRTLLELEGAL